MNERDISDLTHVSKVNAIGQQVVVLNDGAVITAEDRAMLQALHSRDPKGIKSHLDKLTKSGSGKLMQTYYVGYGHKSIGDCGFVTIFAENVSLLAAKAIQDSALYNGQECSTRYIDFSTVPFFNGQKNNLEAETITDKLRSFYTEAMPKLVLDLKQAFPANFNDNPTIYEKAIKARAFDILRGFLPAGALTNVAWTTTLRQVADRISLLRHHPLQEVRGLVEMIEAAVQQAYPNSFGHKIYQSTEQFNSEFNQNYYYCQDKLETDSSLTNTFKGINIELLNRLFAPILGKRPRGSEMPKQVGICGQDGFYLEIDFGSYRDLQRHRAIVQNMPLLTTKLGFESWYMQNLPNELRYEARSLLDQVESYIEKTDDKLAAQYCIPMGYKVGYYISGDLPALSYLAEIRSSSTVHPTARKIAFELGDYLKNTYSVPIYCQKDDLDRFDIKRGTQDIVEK